MLAYAWIWVPALLAVLALLVQGTLSYLETALIGARRSRLPQVATGPALRAAEEMLDNPVPFDTASHVTNTVCEAVTYASAAVFGVAEAARREAWPDPLPATSSAFALEIIRHAVPWVALAVLGSVVCVLLFGEALPKLLATRAPEQILVRRAGFMRLYGVLLSPVVQVLRSTGRVVSRMCRIDPDTSGPAARTEEEIKIIVGGSAEEGVIEEEEKELIHSIFDFTETPARQVMVPRIEIHGICADATLQDAARVLLEEGHSRLPVYEGTLDKIVGLVYAKDLIRHLLDGRCDMPVRETTREPFFVPESKKLDELLAEFRSHRTQMAIVVDEFGGTAGLVTLEDVLEEIVGEIQDEYDAEEPSVQEIEPGVYVVDARLALDDVNEELHLDLPAGESETLGGFVYDLFGRPPQAGEEVTSDGLRFIAEATDGPRLLKVRVVTGNPRSPADRASESPSPS